MGFQIAEQVREKTGEVFEEAEKATMDATEEVVDKMYDVIEKKVNTK